MHDFLKKCPHVVRNCAFSFCSIKISEENGNYDIDSIRATSSHADSSWTYRSTVGGSLDFIVFLDEGKDHWQTCLRDWKLGWIITRYRKNLLRELWLRANKSIIEYFIQNTSHLFCKSSHGIFRVSKNNMKVKFKFGHRVTGPSSPRLIFRS